MEENRLSAGAATGLLEINRRLIFFEFFFLKKNNIELIVFMSYVLTSRSWGERRRFEGLTKKAGGKKTLLGFD